MSINQNVLGLIFASINDSAVIDLTKMRTMGFARMGKFTISVLAMAYFSPLEFSKNICI